LKLLWEAIAFCLKWLDLVGNRNRLKVFCFGLKRCFGCFVFSIETYLGFIAKVCSKLNAIGEDGAVAETPILGVVWIYSNLHP
jgi:hypothetical protein